MTAEIVRASEVNLDDLQRMAKMMVASGYFDAAKDVSQGIAQMAIKIMAGREMGYGPFASVQGIHVIQGKPSIAANLMAAAVKAHPRYDYRVRKMSNEAVSIEFFENGQSLGMSEFTAAEAQAAGLTGKDIWKRFPRNMLFARALSNGVRWYCPDVFNGSAVYVPEELGADIDGEGNIIDMPSGKVDTKTGEIVESRLQPAGVENGRQQYAYKGTPAEQQAIAEAVTGKPANDLPDSLDDLAELAPAGDEPSPDEAMRIQTKEIVEANNLKTPSHAWAWAVTNGYRTNEHSARTEWMQMIDEQFGGVSLTPPKVKEAITTYIELCLLNGKKEPVAA